MLSYQCRDSHYKDKPVSWPSYLYHGNSHTWKDVFHIEKWPWWSDLKVEIRHNTVQYNMVESVPEVTMLNKNDQEILIVHYVAQIVVLLNSPYLERQSLYWNVTLFSPHSLYLRKLTMSWWYLSCVEHVSSQKAKFMGPKCGPPGSCRPQMGPMLAPRTLLRDINSCVHAEVEIQGFFSNKCYITSIGIHIIKTRWSHIFLAIVMEIPVHGKTVYILKVWNRALICLLISGL